MSDHAQASGTHWLALIMLGLMALAGCEKPSGSGPTPQKAPEVIPVLITGGTPVPYETVLRQLTPKPVFPPRGKTARPITSVVDGLEEVQNVAREPVVAMVEQGEWLFYATGAARDAKTNQPVATFLSGYAIKKDGQEILEWSVW